MKLRSGFIVVGGLHPQSIGAHVVKSLAAPVVTLDLPLVVAQHQNIYNDESDRPSIPCDVTEDGQLRDALLLALRMLERRGCELRGVCYAAGYNRMSSVVEQTVDNLERHMAVNVIAPIMLHTHLQNLLPAEKHVQSVIIGSNTAFVARRNSAAYGASKAAIAKAARDLHRELAAYGWSILTLDPGPVFGTQMDEVTRKQLRLEREEYETLILTNVPGRMPLRLEEAGAYAAQLLTSGWHYGGSNLRLDFGQQQG